MKEIIKENLKIITLNNQSKKIKKLLDYNIKSIRVFKLDNRKIKIVFHIKGLIFTKKKIIIANEMHIKQPESYKFQGLKGI